jgi:hypothetical protein
MPGTAFVFRFKDQDSLNVYCPVRVPENIIIPSGCCNSFSGRLLILSYKPLV